MQNKTQTVNSVQTIMSQLFSSQRGAVGRSKSLLFEFHQLKVCRYLLNAKLEALCNFNMQAVALLGAVKAWC